MNIEILDQAVEDLIGGYRFYEDQQEGLGAYFLASLYSDIESLQIYVGIHRESYKNHHRLLCKRFPFAVYYTIEDTTAYISAVVDCRRDPTWIRKRLDR